MSQIVKNIVQRYVSKLSTEEIYTLAKKEDVYAQQRNPHISDGQEDVPVPREEYVHRSALIVKASVNFTSIQHRQDIAYSHPWMKGYLEKVGKALWSTMPVFAKPNTSSNEEPEEDEEIKKFWEENRLQEMLRKAWHKAQVHGIIFYYPMENEGFFQGYSGPPWYIYSVDELLNPSEYKQGHPIKWVVKHTNIYRTDPIEIAINQGVFYDYKNTDDFTGEPFGIGIWDILIDWIWIVDAVNAFDQRMGNGFLTLVVPNNTTDAEISAYEGVIKKTRTEKGLVVRGSVDEPVEVAWQGMAGMQVDFITHLEKLEDLIAFNMGFPKRWIMGDAEGAMESSGKDALQVNIQLKNLFMEWVIFMKRILLFHGKISSLNDITILPPFELQLSEQEQIELDSMKTLMIASKTWLTVNEQRELDGFDPIEGGDTLFESEAGADAPGGMISTQVNPMLSTQVSPGAKKFQTSAKAKADSLDILSEVFTNNEISVRQLADLCGVSPTTISKMREKFDALVQPKWKEDELVIKCDAMCLSEDIYEIEDVPVVLPQKKKYDHLGYEAIRPRDEVERIFSDPTYPKEFRIGVTPSEDHSSRVPLEILKENTVGMVKFTRLDEEGNIRGNIRYSLTEADRVLGKDNFIRDFTSKNENIPTSVALYSRDKPTEKGYIERDLDIRSFVFTRKPRNARAGK